MLPVESPFKTYTGLDGKPLNNGYVYFGLPNENPANDDQQVTVYWDAAGTIPAFQPLRTTNGYIVRAGTPANVFCDTEYSELVQDSKKRPVAYARTSTEFSLATYVQTLLGGVTGPNGSGNIGWKQEGPDAVLSNVLKKLRESVTLEDFGAGFPGVADATALTRALAYCSSFNKNIELLRVYAIDSNVTLPVNVSLRGKSRLQTGLIFSGSAQMIVAGAAGTKNAGNQTFSTMLLSHATSGTVLSMSEFKDILFDDVEIYHASIAATAFSYLTFQNCIGFDYSVTCFGAVNTLNEAPKFLGGRGSNVKIVISNTTDVVIDNYHLLGPGAQISIKRGQHQPGLYPFVSLSNLVVDSTDDECISLDGVSFKATNVFTSGGRTNLKPGFYAHDCVESNISNTTSRFCGGSGVLLDLCRTVSVSGNFADNKEYGILFRDCKNITFTKVYAGNTQGWFGGSYVQQYGIVDSAGTCTDTIVDNCQFVGNSTFSVYLPNATTKFGINTGYVTSNSGTANVTTVAGAATIAHGLNTMPKWASATAVSGADVDTQITGIDTTNITIRVKTSTTNTSLSSDFAVLWAARA